MALDPALADVDLPNDYIAIADHQVDPDAIYLMDFDGVIIDSFEDEIYRLEPDEVENGLFRDVERRFDLKISEMDHRYQRHLLYQAAAATLELPMRPGVGLDLAKRVNAESRLSVLTARSGWYPIFRTRSFLDQHGVHPIETFHVGRVSKRPQIELVLAEFSRRKVVYVEDSMSHLNAVRDIAGDRLTLVHCSKSEIPDNSTIRQHVVDVLQEVRENG